MTMAVTADVVFRSETDIKSVDLEHSRMLSMIEMDPALAMRDSNRERDITV